MLYSVSTEVPESGLLSESLPAMRSGVDTSDRLLFVFNFDFFFLQVFPKACRIGI